MLKKITLSILIAVALGMSSTVHSSDGEEREDEEIRLNHNAGKEDVRLFEEEDATVQEDRSLGLTPLEDEEDVLSPFVHQSVFNLEDPRGRKFCRWLGRAVGALATQGMDPMILFVLLTLFDVPVDSILDYLIIAGLSSYLAPAASSNLATMGENIYDTIFRRTPPIPRRYALEESSSIPLTIASHSHALAMSFMLTSVFESIEAHRHYNWYFWTFFVPYGIALYYKNIKFFKKGQEKQLSVMRHRFESIENRSAREILEQDLKSAQKKFSTLNPEEMREIYRSLIDKDTWPSEKIKQLLRLSGRQDIEQGNDGEELQTQQESIGHSNRSPLTYKAADELARLIFYFSLYPEYFFYQFGLDKLFLLLRLNAPDSVSYVGAGVLSCCSYLFEGENIKQYYRTIFDSYFGSSYSLSNPWIRRGIAVKSFAAGALLALSEILPAWKAVFLGSNNELKYFFLITMAGRHHARNAFWLQGGYDRALSDYHRQNWFKFTCLTCCGKDPSKNQMIDLMSYFTHKLLELTDKLNPEGIEVIKRMGTNTQERV